jgi:hypothetical protein
MSILRRIHGVSVRVSSADCRFLAYCGRFSAAFPEAPDRVNADMDVQIESGVSFHANPGICQRQWGSDVKQRDDSITLCAHPSAGVFCDISEHQRDGSQHIICYFLVARARRILNLLRNRRAAENQRYMTMIRQAVVLPVLARLLHTQGLLTLHASVVALQGQAIALTGLNGCGKSGLALHLVTRHGFSFLSDNFALIDPATGVAHAFPEPIRVGSREREEAQGFFAGEDYAFGKWQLSPLPQKVCPAAPIGCLVKIHIGERFAIREVEAGPFADDLDSFHRFLGETPEYSWPQLYYQMRYGINLGQAADTARHQLCSKVPCFEMEIPRAATSEQRYQEAARWIASELAKPS